MSTLPLHRQEQHQFIGDGGPNFPVDENRIRDAEREMRQRDMGQFDQQAGQRDYRDEVQQSINISRRCGRGQNQQQCRGGGGALEPEQPEQTFLGEGGMGRMPESQRHRQPDEVMGGEGI